MINVLTCPSCGLQFKGANSGERCPVCNTRGTSQQGRRSRAAYAFDLRSGGLRAMGVGGGRSIVLAIAAVVLFPFFLTTGLVALTIGAIFDIAALVIVGIVLMSIGAVAFAFFLWKLWRGIRGATRAWQDLSTRADVIDEDRVSGRWENS